MAQTKTETPLREQRVVLPTAEELRKGVNVLNTSDPRNPAVNPFVQQQSSQKDGTHDSAKSGKK